MAYIGNINGIAKKIAYLYLGNSYSKATKVKKAYIGDTNGTARLWWDDGTITPDTPDVSYDYLWYQGSIDRASITSITVTKTYYPTGTEDEMWATSVTTLAPGVYDPLYGKPTQQYMPFNANVYRKGTTITIASQDGQAITLFNNCRGIFSGFKALTTISGLSNFDAQYVTDLGNAFSGCSSLTTLSLSGWITSNVNYMDYAFSGCSNLTSISFGVNWLTNKVSDMSFMFSGCRALTSLNCSGWNTSRVVTFKNMFRNCLSLTELDLSKWDTRSVYNMSCMFAADDNTTTHAMTSLNLSGWNTANVSDMSYMFFNFRSKSLRELDLSSFTMTNIYDASFMFCQASRLDTIKVTSSKWQIPSSAKVDYMYYQCHADLTYV